MHGTYAGLIEPAMRTSFQANMRGPIQVGLAHADPIMGAGLRSAFDAFDDFEVSPRLQGASVIVADYASALSLMDAARARQGRAPAVVVTGSDRECEIRRALALGAKGYLVAFTPEDLAACVRAVDRGEKYLSAAAARRLAESVSREPLTGREKEVMRLLARGLANKQIANQLGIALYTVKSHLKSIFDKLQVRSRTQAMATVEARGILDV